MIKRIATAAAVAGAVITFAPAANAASQGGEVSAVAAMNIATNAHGLRLHMDTTVRGTAWMVVEDGRVVFYRGASRLGDHLKIVHFPGHTGAHIVTVYKDGRRVFKQTLHTGLA